MANTFLRQKDVANKEDLLKLQPEDMWICYVEDEEKDYIYDAEKNLWIPFTGNDIIKFDQDEKIVSSKPKFQPVDINDLVLTIVLGLSIGLALWKEYPEIALGISSLLASKVVGQVGGMFNSNNVNSRSKMK